MSLSSDGEVPRVVSQCVDLAGDGRRDMAGANISDLPSIRQHCDRQFADDSSAASFTLGHARSIGSLFLHRQHRHFRLETNTSLSSSSTPFRLQSNQPHLSSVFSHHLSHMAVNTESTHRRSGSAASSDDEAGSNEGSSGGSASTVPTVNSSPLMGPQNHPGIPPQFHLAPVNAVHGNPNQTADLDDDAFGWQLDEVETQMRLLGVDINELHQIECDIMFAQYYYHYDPNDPPFPPSNTVEAINASMNYNNVPWGTYQHAHVPDEESDTESNNEATIAAYETPLPHYHVITSHNDFMASAVARPGTVAGMAIRDPSQPAHTPPIIGAGAQSPADAITEMTQDAHAGAVPASESSAPADELDPNLAAVVHNLEAGPVPASTLAVSEEAGANATSTDPDTFLDAPIFPASWVTHTRNSVMPSRQPPTTRTRRHSYSGSINYTISPISNRFTEDREGEGA